MSNNLIFKTETLAPVLADVKANDCELWFLVDDGIYLTAEKARFVNGKRNISYAEGFDPDLWDDAGALFDAIDCAVGGGDLWESVKLEPEMLAILITHSADLIIRLSDTQFVFEAQIRQAGEKAC